MCFGFLCLCFLFCFFWTWDILVNVNLFFFFFFVLKRDFYRNMNATEQNSCLLNTVHSASFLFLVLPMKQPECSPPHPQREYRNVFRGVHVFEFKALYVIFFFLFSSCLVWNNVRLVLISTMEKRKQLNVRNCVCMLGKCCATSQLFIM